MARQLLRFSLGLLLALAVSSTKAVSQQLDCSDRYSRTGTTFTYLNETCPELFEMQRANAAQYLSPHLRLEKVESCSCALLNHQIGWSSLITHQLEAFHQSIKQFIDEREEKDDKIRNLTNSRAGVFFEGEEGQRRYYWDALQHITSNATKENDSQVIFEELAKVFSGVYYESGFKQKFSHASTQKLFNPLLQVCNYVKENFSDYFIPKFNKLGIVAKNPRLNYRLAGYNADLNILFMADHICAYLRKQGNVFQPPSEESEESKPAVREGKPRRRMKS